MFDKLLHQIFRIPYRLNANFVRQNTFAKTTIVFLHGLGSSNRLWDGIEDGLNSEKIQVISVDLLGHGDSPKPTWFGAMSLKNQARALQRTLLKSHILSQNIVLVGHSLGSLVVTEFAKIQPRKIKSLVLISPPIYIPDQKADLYEKGVRKIYKFLLENRRISSEMAKIVYGKMVKGGSDVGEEEFSAIMDSVEFSILGQKTYKTLRNISIDTRILAGKFDPLIINKNIESLSRINRHISTKSIFGGHEIRTLMRREIIKQLNQILEEN